MVSSSQPMFSRQDLNKLQRLRASILAFQNRIAPLPANDVSDADNEQFNQLRREVKTVLKISGFDREVAQATTRDSQIERVQKVLVPRLFGIMTVGVFLALVGLGVNSIILDQLVINVLACLVSSTGMLLVIGTFVVYQLNQSANRLSNYADLYQRCEALLAQINRSLAEAGWSGDPHQVPSVTELALDSLRNLAADWEAKLAGLEAQAAVAEPNPPVDLTAGLDFVRRELNRVNIELDRLERQAEGRLLEAGPAQPETPPVDEAAAPVQRPVEPSPDAIEKAGAHTLGMPASKTKAPPPPKKEVRSARPAVMEGASANSLDNPPVTRADAKAPPASDSQTASPQVTEIASALTMDMPVISPDDATTAPEAHETPPETDEESEESKPAAD